MASIKHRTQTSELSGGGLIGAGEWDEEHDVVLTKADVGLGNVDNTSDAAKPISTAVQAALDTKIGITVSTQEPSGTASQGHLWAVVD